MADMSYRPLGDSGLIVSTVGLGCNAFGARIDAGTTRAVVHAALDQGITLFDTADTYGGGASETLLGESLGQQRGRRRRGDEVRHGRARRERSGLGRKVRYIGSSNFAGWQVVDADWVARTSGYERFVSAQNRYSLYDRSAEAELAPACEQAGVGILPFFPLQYGLLTGKYRRGEPAPEGTRLAVQTARLENADFDRIEALERFAAERGGRHSRRRHRRTRGTAGGRVGHRRRNAS